MFSYFITQTYVKGAQKTRLNETVLLSTQNILFELISKIIFTILRSKTCSTGPMMENPAFLYLRVLSSHLKVAGIYRSNFRGGHTLRHLRRVL